jgi:predicted nucleic acid-binding protein
MELCSHIDATVTSNEQVQPHRGNSANTVMKHATTLMEQVKIIDRKVQTNQRNSANKIIERKYRGDVRETKRYVKDEAAKRETRDEEEC